MIYLFSRITIFVIVLLVLNVLIIAAPVPNHQEQGEQTKQTRQTEQTEQSFLGSLASRTLGAFVRGASYVFRLLPSLPEFLKPAKPTLRLVQPKSVYIQNTDISLEDLEFD